MATVEKLRLLLNKKAARQSELEKKVLELESLDDKLSGNKLYRAFGSGYLIAKRIITLLLGLTLIIGSITLILYPEILLSDETFRKEMIEQSKKYYAEVAGFTLEQAIEQVILENSGYSLDNLISHLDESFEKALEEEIRKAIIFESILLLITGVILLYISRLTRKMWLRNRKISSAESLTQELLRKYKTTLNEEQSQLDELNEIVESLIEDRGPSSDEQFAI